MSESRKVIWRSPTEKESGSPKKSKGRVSLTAKLLEETFEEIADDSAETKRDFVSTKVDPADLELSGEVKDILNSIKEKEVEVRPGTTKTIDSSKGQTNEKKQNKGASKPDTNPTLRAVDTSPRSSSSIISSNVSLPDKEASTKDSTKKSPYPSYMQYTGVSFGNKEEGAPSSITGSYSNISAFNPWILSDGIPNFDKQKAAKSESLKRKNSARNDTTEDPSRKIPKADTQALTMSSGDIREKGIQHRTTYSAEEFKSSSSPSNTGGITDHSEQANTDTSNSSSIALERQTEDGSPIETSSLFLQHLKQEQTKAKLLKSTLFDALMK